MEFTHFDEKGASRMVDVSGKVPTKREAAATGRVTMNKETLQKIVNMSIKKGNVFEVARIAAIMAVKQTPHLIPLCHPLAISKVNVEFSYNIDKGQVDIEVTVGLDDKTGVEMEALTGVSVAALTIYDMCKAVDKDMIISDKDYPYPYNENYTTSSYIYKLLLNHEFIYNTELKLPPCRMEKLGNVILDGSHNMSGILKIKETWKKQNISAVIFTVTNDRNIENTAEILKQVSHNLIVTTLPDNIRSIKEYSKNDIVFIQSPVEAIIYAKNHFTGTILVTGSFKLCAYIKEYINGSRNEI